MTAPASPAGPTNRARARSRASCRPRSAACSDCGRAAGSPLPAAPMPACTPAARSATSTFPRERWPRCRARPARTAANRCCAGWRACCRRDVRVRSVSRWRRTASTRASRRSSRRYAYRVADTPYGVDPLRRHDVLWHHRPLDLDL